MLFQRFFGFIVNSRLASTLGEQSLREVKEPFHTLTPFDRCLVKYVILAALQFPLFVLVADQ